MTPTGGRVDGDPVTVERANFQFRAVPIPAGTSEVTFEYRPRVVYWGCPGHPHVALGHPLLAGVRTSLGRRIGGRIEALGRRPASPS